MLFPVFLNCHFSGLCCYVLSSLECCFVLLRAFVQDFSTICRAQFYGASCCVVSFERCSFLGQSV